MRILLTRPRDDSAELADRLRAAGHETINEPMLEIRFLPDAHVDLNGVQALLFTSANGVRAFAAVEARRDLPVFAVGDATAAVARRIGFARVESAAGRVDDLARLVRERLSPAAGALVHVAGREVAGDLAGDLGGAGFEVRRAVLYVAEAARALPPDTARALKAGEIDAAVFYSARSAEAFRHLIEEGGLAFSLSRMTALGLSEAAIDPLRSLPWAKIDAAPRPEESALMALIAAQPREATSPHAPPPKPDSAIPRRRLFSGWRPARKPSAPATHGRYLVPMVWLAVLLSLGTFFLQATQPNQSVSDLTPAAAMRLTTLERRIDALARAERAGAPDPQTAARVKELGDRLDALAARQAQPSPAGDGAALAERVDGLEKRLASAEADRQGLADEVKNLQAKAPGGPGSADLAALADDDKRLSGEVAELQKQVAALQAMRERNTAQAGILLAVGQIALAAANGHTVAPAIATLRPLAGDDPHLTAALAELQPVADRAVPTMGALIDRFPAVATAALRAAHRENRPASSNANGRFAAWWDDIVRRLSASVTVRRVGEIAGDSPEARVARAEQRLAGHDLAGAVDALSGLTGAPAKTVASWLDDARARLTMDKAIGDLSSAAIATAGPPR